METITEIKERLHPMLENVGNIELLEKVEQLIYSEMHVDEELTEEEIILFEKRRKAYLNGEGKTLSWEEVKEFARASKK
jgi:Putative addiction module component